MKKIKVKIKPSKIKEITKKKSKESLEKEVLHQEVENFARTVGESQRIEGLPIGEVINQAPQIRTRRRESFEEIEESKPYEDSKSRNYNGQTNKYDPSVKSDSALPDSSGKEFFERSLMQDRQADDVQGDMLRGIDRAYEEQKQRRRPGEG